MTAQRVLPPIDDEMFSGFESVSLLMREASGLILSKTNLGVECAFPNCHAVVRVIHRFVKDAFDIVDGFIPMVKASVKDGKVGTDCVPMYHSWLALKRDRRCIIDVLPIGSIPPFPSPVFLYLDEYSPEYVPCLLDEVVSMGKVAHDAEYMFRVLGQAIVARQQKLQNAA